MDPKFQPSFIPRRPVVPGGMAAIAQKQPPSILGIVGGVVFVIVLALAGVSFFYERSLAQTNESKKQQIQAEIDALDPTVTNELLALKERIDAAEVLLKQHTALSDFFDMLQKNTISTIRFKEFSYTIDDEGGPMISMKGESNGFNDLVLQSDLFLKNPYLKNVMFYEYQLDEKGKVTFTVDAFLDPELVAFQKKPQTTAPAAVPPLDPITASSSATTTPATTQATSSTTTNP